MHECQFSIRFDFLDLIAKKLVVPKHAFNITAKERGQLTPVSRFDMVAALLQTLSDPLAPQGDAVEREETLDPTDKTRPLLNQVLALSFDPVGIWTSGATSRSPEGHARSVRVIPSASSRSVFARRPFRGMRKLAGLKTMVRMPRAISSLASQKPS